MGRPHFGGEKKVPPTVPTASLGEASGISSVSMFSLFYPPDSKRGQALAFSHFLTKATGKGVYGLAVNRNHSSSPGHSLTLPSVVVAVVFNF